MSGPVVCSVLLTEDQLSLLEDCLTLYDEQINDYFTFDLLTNRKRLELNSKIDTIRLVMQQARESGRVD